MHLFPYYSLEAQVTLLRYVEYFCALYNLFLAFTFRLSVKVAIAAREIG